MTEKNQVLQGQYQALVATRQELKKIFQELELVRHMLFDPLMHYLTLAIDFSRNQRI